MTKNNRFIDMDPCESTNAFMISMCLSKGKYNDLYENKYLPINIC